MGRGEIRDDARFESDAAPPRLVPERPLPPYRYLPGRGRHPLRHPEGYLHGREPTVDPTPLTTACRENRDHLYAIDLWNRGYHWEAHEAWEGLWKLLPRECAEAQALQGLIQAAAALLKDHLAQTVPAERLAAAARTRLEGALRDATRGPPLLGIDLADLVRRFAAYRADPRPDLYPYICLEE